MVWSEIRHFLPFGLSSDMDIRAFSYIAYQSTVVERLRMASAYLLTSRWWILRDRIFKLAMRSSLHSMPHIDRSSANLSQSLCIEVSMKIAGFAMMARMLSPLLHHINDAAATIQNLYRVLPLDFSS
jgi:hypothetical protein